MVHWYIGTLIHCALTKKIPLRITTEEDIPKTDYIFIYQPLVAKAVMTPLKADKFKIKQKKTAGNCLFSGKIYSDGLKFWEPLDSPGFIVISAKVMFNFYG